MSPNSNDPKAVLQYDVDMRFIKEYPSANSAQIDGFKGSEVSNVCNGRKDTYKGFIWLWKDNPKLHFQNKNKRKDKVLQDKYKNSKDILQFDLDGNLIKLWKRIEFEYQNEYKVHSVQSVCSGYGNTYKNYIWKYLEEKIA